jgi:hypothetical protein
MEWVRLHHDMPTDPKWRVIAKKAGQRIGDVIAVYTFVLVNASCNAVKRGETHSLDAEDIGAALDLDPASVTAILDAMQGKVLDGAVLRGWEKRNPKREDSSTDRVRKHRETHGNASKRIETLEQSRTEQRRSEEKEITLPAEAGRVREKSSSPEFEEFWKAFKPPPNAKKPDALKAWNSVAKTRPLQAELLRAVAAYNTWLAEESRKQKRDYPKQHAATWLRGEVWNGYLDHAGPVDLAKMRASRDNLASMGYPTAKLDRAIEEAEANAA